MAWSQTRIDNLVVDTLIGIDLRAPGRAAEVVRQMLAAVYLTLERHEWGGGEASVDVVRGDAAALAADPHVLAVIGPFRTADTAAASTDAVLLCGVPMMRVTN